MILTFACIVCVLRTIRAPEQKQEIPKIPSISADSNLDLPQDDEALLLRAKAALADGNAEKAARLLEAAEEQTGAQWYLLRGACALSEKKYAEAIQYFKPVEELALAQLERCYEGLEDYKMAYYYAKRQSK